MSDWGWHSFANPENYQPEESWRYYDFGRGRKEPYATQVKDNKRAKAAGDWYRVNPHRLHLGTLGLSLGADPKQIKQIDQTLNMWEGMIKSSFIYKGKAYQVETTCDPVLDMIATHIQSKEPSLWMYASLILLVDIAMMPATGLKTSYIPRHLLLKHPTLQF